MSVFEDLIYKYKLINKLKYKKSIYIGFVYNRTMYVDSVVGNWNVPVSDIFPFVSQKSDSWSRAR